MHKNYQIFSRSPGSLTHPLHKIIFPSCRLCSPESFPLKTLWEEELWCLLTLPHSCLSNTAVCMHSLGSSTQKTGDTELSWKPNFNVFSYCERALFHYIVCLCIYFWRMMSSLLFYEDGYCEEPWSVGWALI